MAQAKELAGNFDSPQTANGHSLVVTQNLLLIKMTVTTHLRDNSTSGGDEESLDSLFLLGIIEKVFREDKGQTHYYSN